MNDQDTSGASDASQRQDSRRAEDQDRPPIIAFDPYFGSRSGGDRRDTSDFDEMMWERVA